MTYSTELRQRLEAGIQELDVDIARMRAALVALDGRAATPDSAAARRGRRPTERVAARAARERTVVPAGKLASLLSGSEGLSTAELAQQTNGAPDQVLLLLKELEQAGRAYRSGTRRSTRWHAGAGTGSDPAG
ncbi:MAG: hypothetical protein ACR2NR_09975 [Solirubrobacteraceae bacterium]